MPFVDQIVRCGSLSVVGLGKNTGKTECLRYVIKRLSEMQKVVAVTSIGVDGERTDQVTHTAKPDIFLDRGMYFTTAASYYLEKRFDAEICHVGEHTTVLGKMVTARALERGKMILAGPSDTVSLREWIMQIPKRFHVDVCLVDGAISRLSPASPVVTASMVLATGAAYSPHMKTLVEKTRYVYDTICLPRAPEDLVKKLEGITNGVRAVTPQGDVTEPIAGQALLSEQVRQVLEKCGDRLYVPGVVSNILLKALGERKNASETELYIRDFTRIFAEPRVFYTFLRKGGRIFQLYKTNLLAVCVNPVSPDGVRLDSGQLVDKIQQAIEVPVYDIKRMEK
ncbi:MAG TPA: hypothetical protein PLM86_03400 [Bacteroidales bacterium]|nr:MAG: hypothetical protein BWX93_00229 [Bacteroidetes bacterium ADurb.Bin139]HOG25217.1 hypothetical protein [Bacteroidales bacterium]HOZ18996.1 hypothetical protein [Bacteroidales bacterium]HPB77669.1 hypothetical protein [Bacteroidales bacterium]HQN81161.1 hypothetical protein [Bacteroidales bacterium]